MTAPVEDIERLLVRLREQVASGHFTLGGGSISHDGKGEMWGGEPIMVQRNPDGPTAATVIETQAARIRTLEAENAGLREGLEPFAQLHQAAKDKAEAMGCKDGNAAVSVPRALLARVSLTLNRSNDDG